MATLHPHWHATEEDERPVSISIVDAPKEIPRATRRPAAIAGVAVFVLIGIALMQGAGSILGQANTAEKIVVVSASGLTPSVISVMPGETITWRNDDTIPHIFTSLTLPSGNTEPFESSPVFPQSSISYTIPIHASAGIHEYISTTSTQVMGQIIITTGATASISQPSQAQQAVSSAPSFIQTTTSSMPMSQGEIPDQMIGDGMIPENPYTVGSIGNVPPVRQGAQTTAQRAAISDHLPQTTAASGTGGIVALVLLSIAGLFVVTRSIFQRL